MAPTEDELPDEFNEDDGVLEPADSLITDDMADDPLNTGILPADRYSPAESFGTTTEEAREGESLDRLLSEEEPDEDPAAVDDRWEEGPAPRSGRLIDEGSGTAFDAGPDGGAAGAEEAAVHITEGDLDPALDDAPDEGPL